MHHQSNRWIFLVLLALVPLLPLLAQTHVLLQHDYFLSDLHHSHLPIRAFIGKEIASGTLPLWWPDVYSGVPLWAQIEGSVLWAPQWFAFGLFEPYVAFNYLTCFHVLLSAVGTFALGRAYGMSGSASALGGIVFGLCGFNLSHLRNPNLHAASAMLPWVLWAGERVIASPNGRSWALLGASIGLQNFAGMPQITYYTLLALAARWLWYVGGDWWLDGKRPSLRVVTGFATACLLGMLLAALILLPTWMFNQYTVRAGGLVWEQVAAGGFNHWDFLALVYPPASGDSYLQTYRGGSSSWNTYGFCGVLASCLAVFGVLRSAEQRLAGFLLVSAPLVLSLIIGTNNPLFYWIWHWVPGMNLFRRPARFLVLLNLGVAVGAGLGLDVVLSRWRVHANRIALSVILITVMELAYFGRPHLPMEPIGEWASPAPAVETVISHGDLGRTYLLEDYLRWSEVFHRNQGFARAGHAPFRSLAGLPLGSAGSLYGLKSSGGYVVLTSQRVSEYWMRYPTHYQFLDQKYQPEIWENGRLSESMSSLLRRANVAYLISATPLQKPFVSLGNEVYVDPKRLPRAYFATFWVSQPDRRATGRWLLGAGSEFPEVPAIEGANAPLEAVDRLQAASRETRVRPVEVSDISNHELRQRVGGLGEGWLILSDAWDPGWEAQVDGEVVPIHVANGFQRAVWLSDGASEVIWRYRPVGLIVGSWITLVSAVLLLLLAVLNPRGLPAERDD